MIGTFIRRSLFLTILLAMQALVFNHVKIMGYAIPMICTYGILLIPLGTPRWQILLWGFFTGLIQDIFSNTPGMNAAALTLVALIQPILLKNFSPRETDETEQRFIASARNMNWGPFLRYVATAIIIQQAVFYMLEAFSFFNPFEMAINILGGSLTSFLIIIAMESVRKGTGKS